MSLPAPGAPRSFSARRALCACILLAGAVTVTASPAAQLRERQAGVPILLGNDDGWAEANIRALYQVLTRSGYKTLVSAPAYDQSGTGSSSAPPAPLTSPGEFNSIPAGAPGVGHNTTDDHLWYVNAYPADGITYALANLTTPLLGGPPALVLTGPNVGSNLGLTTLVSGTVGAACAAGNAGLPALAISAATGDQRSYTELVDGDYSYIYAEAAQTLAAALLASGGAPLLPAHTILNVNFPAAGPGTACPAASAFKFVLSRVYPDLGLPLDTCTCGGCALPSESSVVGTPGGCYASVSPMDARTKLTAGKSAQGVVKARLARLLTCLPN